MSATSPDLVPILLTGMARSGTTYLGELANRYLDIAAVNEGTFEHWLLERDCRPQILRDDLAFHALLKGFADHIYFHFLFKKDHSVETVLSELLPLIEERSQRGLALAALKLAAQRWQRPRLGHEDPVFMYKLEQVVDMYPGCKLIHIVRDPRDVTASVLQFPWGPNNAVVAGNDWNRLIEKARRLGANLGKHRYFEFRYEDLLTNPGETMAALLQFVTGAVDVDKVAAFEQETSINPLRGNFGNWKKGLTSHQVQLVEAASQDQMRHFAYIPEYPPRRISPAAVKIWRLHHRALQVRNILFGKLHINGLGKIDPPSPLRGPHKLQEVATR
jgi:Sulfotransferase family